MKSTTAAIVSIALLLVTSTMVHAEISYLSGYTDHSLGANEYSLTLPPAWGGGTTTMPLDSGYYVFRLDDALHTAEVLEWRQWVGAFTIQGHSSGQITVTLDPSLPSTGIYYPPDSFIVTSGFIFEFDDTELSGYGITSPMPLTAKDKCTREDTLPTEPPNPFPPFRIVMRAEGSVDIGKGETLGYSCITNAKMWYSTAIPTLTEWGLIIFGVVLLGFISWVFIKRRKVIGVRA